MQTLSLTALSGYLTPRPRNSHKGDFGHVLIIGGDIGYSGAVRMAAEAALRIGAGLVSIATHKDHANLINTTRPEIMSHPITYTAQLKPLLKKATIIVLGPGLGQSTWSKTLFKHVINLKIPMLVDADGLNLLAQKPIKKPEWILTPHPGEAARLLQSQTIQQNRQQAANDLQKKYGGTIVLKGAGTLVTNNKEIAICQAGNPGMATAGMGDVLSGIIAGLVAQHIPMHEAAKLGVILHAIAADLCAKEHGERGMLATDLMPYLQTLANPT